MQPQGSQEIATLQKERQELRAQLANALEEDEDPLAAYHTLVQWIVKNYGENDPNSGLLEVLEEAVRRFRDDPNYKKDLRHLKLWTMYARQSSKPATIYSFLLTNDIGTTYSVLFEEYANALERDGLFAEADGIYRMGIKRKVRPIERLKTRYQEFQARRVSSSSLPPVPQPSSSSKHLVGASATGYIAPKNTSTAKPAVSNGTTRSLNFSTNAEHGRYALMLAPPIPGKRPERLRFNLSLLFTEEGVEYCMPEARARSMGLLGKNWGPLPRTEEMQSSSSLSVPVDFNDSSHNRRGNTITGGRRKSYLAGGGAEPTVTINTKEALADVFGMYNSPEKTRNLATPGSKHAPVKKVEPVTPATIPHPPPPVAQSQMSNENAGMSIKTPTPAFRPFVDEAANRKPNITPGPSKFKPFVDPDLNNSFVTPDVSRRALSMKEITPGPTPHSNNDENAPRDTLKSKSYPREGSNVFAKVFTPVSTRPHFSTDEHSNSPNAGQPQPTDPFRPHGSSTNAFFHSNANKSTQDEVPPLSTSANTRTPFKVFSRPPSENENVFSFKSEQVEHTTASQAFHPAPSKGTFTPFSTTRSNREQVRDGLFNGGSAFAPQAPAVFQDDDVEEDTSSEDRESYDEIEDQPVEEEFYEEEVSQSYPEVPLGGRFGQFNVMTPITERTFELTMNSRASISDTPTHNTEFQAFDAAGRLAAELREENDRSLVSRTTEEKPLPPFRLSDGHTIEVSEDDLAELEEKTGNLTLSNALAIARNFKPPNPCNPFDPPILSTLLSLMPKDSEFYDFTTEDANQLEGLSKFAKRTRKTSGNTSHAGLLDTSSCFPLHLGGRKFSVSEKLGEGGFGQVFKAVDLPSKPPMDEEDEFADDDDDDESEPSLVAIKVVKPRNIWEYFTLRRVHNALPSHLRRSVIRPHAVYAYRDESFLVLDLCPQGSLLDVVNNAVSAGVSQQGACLDELLVVFFSIELLRLLEGMHNTGFIHGDLKIDNCLLRLEEVPGGAAAWTSLYQATGEGGWNCKGVKVIDFGRTIDTRSFPAGQEFVADWPIDERDCLEMRENRSWTFQTDYYGLAGIIYCMLYGKYMQASVVIASDTEDGMRHKLSAPFKRYWQGDLWTRLFDLLLNPCLARPRAQLPVCDELGELRKEMETWLQSNCNRSSNTLKGLLKKVELSVWRG